VLVTLAAAHNTTSYTTHALVPSPCQQQQWQQQQHLRNNKLGPPPLPLPWAACSHKSTRNTTGTRTPTLPLPDTRCVGSWNASGHVCGPRQRHHRRHSHAAAAVSVVAPRRFIPRPLPSGQGYRVGAGGGHRETSTWRPVVTRRNRLCDHTVSVRRRMGPSPSPEPAGRRHGGRMRGPDNGTRSWSKEHRRRHGRRTMLMPPQRNLWCRWYRCPPALAACWHMLDTCVVWPWHPRTTCKIVHPEAVAVAQVDKPRRLLLWKSVARTCEPSCTGLW